MRKPWRILAWLGAILLGVPLLAVAGLLLAANIAPGQRLIARLVNQQLAGQLHIEALGGRFPDQLRLGRLDVLDADGAWLHAEDMALDWSPRDLLHRRLQLDLASAGRIEILRAPASSGGGSGGSSALPVAIELRQLHIGHLVLGPALAGIGAELAIDGTARAASLRQASATLHARRLDAPGAIDAEAALAADRLHAVLHVDEPSGGVVANLVGLPNLGAMRADATIDGPRGALAVEVAMAAGPLQATAQGEVDAEHLAANLHVTGHAPAMAPRPDLAWNTIALDAQVSGPFARPTARGTLAIDGLAAGGAALQSARIDLAGDQGALTLHGVLAGLRIPGPRPDLLAAAPVTLDAAAQLDAPGRPVTLHIAHKLLDAALDGHLAPEPAATLHATLPDLAPFAALGGVDLAGHASIDAEARREGDTTHLRATAALGITGGMAPVPALIGPDGKLAVVASLAGDDLALSAATLDGRALSLGLSGTDRAGVLALDWRVALSDLSAAMPRLAGALSAQGSMAGAPDHFAVDATLDGRVAAAGQDSGPLHATLHAEGLPGAPQARLAIEGALAGAPVALDATVSRGTDGTLAARIDRADWQSAHAEADLALPAGADLPRGHAALRMTRLAELRPLLGTPISGSLDATLDLPPDGTAALDLTARGIGVPGSSVTSFVVKGTLADPRGNPVANLTASADGIQASGASGAVRLGIAGPLQAIAVKLQADLKDPTGAPGHLAAAATVDAVARNVVLGMLTADSRGLVARLLGPARFGFAAGAIDVDRLRLAIGTATLDLAGKLSPLLDARLAVRNITPDLARPFAPALDADGRMEIDARLTGAPARPDGHIELAASGLRLRAMPGRALPPAGITVTADLGAGMAKLDARLVAGRSHVTLAGSAPLDPQGALALRLGGVLDLALLDPVLTAAGRRARGLLTLAASIDGPATAPALGGGATLADGEVQDFTQGLRIQSLTAELRAEGQTLRIASLRGQAGQGSIGASGTIGVLAPGLPVDVHVTASKAKLLDSDLLTAAISTDLALRGEAAGQLAIGGKLTIDTAAIRVPEKLPTSVATLNVRRAGAPPPPPPAPSTPVALDIAIDAPNPVFIRGRGLDAELEGRMHVGGTSAAPLPTGELTMRRGTFSLAGSTLTFTTGRVQFGGGAISDPLIDFVAQTITPTVTASLEISGTASKPEIKLSSVPELPQDEVLAQLLFAQQTSQLSPFQLAAIAQALAQLAGVNVGLTDPLDRLRKTLGLDRLSVGGGGQSGSTASVEAGSYVATGVYVGARQGIGRSNTPPSAAAGSAADTTQATVQIDLTRRLKLEADVGAGPGGNAVGLTWQVEY